jgi:hypothetical protein
MVVWHEHNVPKGCQFSAKSLVHCSRSCETVTKHDRDQLFRSFLELVRNHSVWFCINCETFPDEQQEVWHFPLCFLKPFLSLSQASQEVLWIWQPPLLDILFSRAFVHWVKHANSLGLCVLSMEFFVAACIWTSQFNF